MKNNWFDEQFLSSIFSKPCVHKWLTAKQTEVCIRYMTQKTATIETASGYQRHETYVYIWQGREVSLSYSKKNGCGTITFGYTESEMQQAKQANADERAHKIMEQAKRAKERRPERYHEKIASMNAKIRELTECISDCIADEDTNGIENLYADLESVKKELKIWENA